VPWETAPFGRENPWENPKIHGKIHGKSRITIGFDGNRIYEWGIFFSHVWDFFFATQRGSTHRILWKHHGDNPGDIVGISGIYNQEYDSLRL
jgi:hypothetical protein